MERSAVFPFRIRSIDWKKIIFTFSALVISILNFVFSQFVNLFQFHWKSTCLRELQEWRNILLLWLDMVKVSGTWRIFSAAGMMLSWVRKVNTFYILICLCFNKYFTNLFNSKVTRRLKVPVRLWKMKASNSISLTRLFSRELRKPYVISWRLLVRQTYLLAKHGVWTNVIMVVLLAWIKLKQLQSMEKTRYDSDCILMQLIRYSSSVFTVKLLFRSKSGGVVSTFHHPQWKRTIRIIR